MDDACHGLSSAKSARPMIMEADWRWHAVEPALDYGQRGTKCVHYTATKLRKVRVIGKFKAIEAPEACTMQVYEVTMFVESRP